jgi:hypothetical protein
MDTNHAEPAEKQLTRLPLEEPWVLQECGLLFKALSGI